MVARGAAVAAVLQDSTYWSAVTAALTAGAVAALRAWTRRWFFVLNIGACVLWFFVLVQCLFIPLRQWSAAEVTLPVAQLGVRIVAGVYTTTPHGPQSDAERMVWSIGLWGISVAVYALIRLWYVHGHVPRNLRACTVAVCAELRPCARTIGITGTSSTHRCGCRRYQSRSRESLVPH